MTTELWPIDKPLRELELTAKSRPLTKRERKCLKLSAMLDSKRRDVRRRAVIAVLWMGIENNLNLIIEATA